MAGSMGSPSGVINYDYNDNSTRATATQVMVQQQQAAQQLQNMNQHQLQQMQQQYWSQPMTGVSLTGTNYTITTTGDGPSWQKEYEVSRIVRRAKNGYFVVITVDATDDVFYRVWRGGWFPFLVAKAFKRFGADIDGNRGSWNTVTKRSHLPATLGSAYEKIDEAIKEDIENEDHEGYVKELLGTKPENLKMIGSLEKLAEGDVDAKDDDPAVSSNASSNWISGTVAIAPLASQPGNTISFTPPAGPGHITGVGTMEAKNIILNGTDLAQSVDAKITEATAILEERLDSMMKDNVKLAKAP